MNYKTSQDSKIEKISLRDEQIIRASKEIIIKFIETGRVSPTNFEEIFTNVYKSIECVVKKNKI